MKQKLAFPRAFLLATRMYCLSKFLKKQTRYLAVLTLLIVTDCLQSFAQAPYQTNILLPLSSENAALNTNTAQSIDKLFDGDTLTAWAPGYDGSFLTNDPLEIKFFFQYEQDVIVKRLRIRTPQYGGDDYGGHPTKYYLRRRDNGTLVQIASYLGAYPSQWLEYTPDSFFIADALIIKSVAGSQGKGGGTFYGAEMQIIADARPKAAISFPLTKPKIGDMFGTNGFWWDLIQDPYNSNPGFQHEYPTKTHHLSDMALKTFRMYTSWEQFEQGRDTFSFSPTLNGWLTDSALSVLKRRGIDPLLCVMGMPAYMFQTYPTGAAAQYWSPVFYDSTAKKGNASAYDRSARLGFLVGARYGRNASVPDSLMGKAYHHNVTWRPDNQVRKGLDLLTYYEPLNEEDQTWNGPNAYMSGYQIAPFLSAAYDGDQGRINIGFGPGVGVGIKNADSTMKLVIGGFAIANTNALRAIWDWSREHRGYKSDGSVDLPYDVINYHKYSNDGGLGGQYDPITTGYPIEMSVDLGIAEKFKTHAREFAGNRPVWLTEWGYDYHDSSTYAAPAVAPYSNFDMVAAWAVRSMLVYPSTGIDRMTWFKLYDDDGRDPQFFSSMSQLGSDSASSKRQVANFMQQLSKFKEYAFDTILRNTVPRVYRYKRATDGKYMYAVWGVETTTPLTRIKFTRTQGYFSASTVAFYQDTGSYLLSLPGVSEVIVNTFQLNEASTLVTRTVNISGSYSAHYGSIPIFIEPGENVAAVSCRAMNFDGINDEVNIPDQSISGDFTVEAWVRLNTTGASHDVVVGDESGGQNLNFYANTFRLWTGSMDAIVAKTSNAANTWTHYAVTRQGSQMSLYINGQLDTTRSTTWSGAFTPQVLGRSGSYALAGQLDEVRIWNTARGSVQIGADYNKVLSPQTYLQAYYRFDEADTAQAVTDVSGNGRTATRGSTLSSEASDAVRTSTYLPALSNESCIAQRIVPRSVQVEKIPGMLTKVFPNPTQQDVTITIVGKNGGMYSVRIMDESGRIVYKKELHLKEKGSDSRTIRLPGHGSGVFMVEIKGEGSVHVEKIMRF